MSSAVESHGRDPPSTSDREASPQVPHDAQEETVHTTTTSVSDDAFYPMQLAPVLQHDTHLYENLLFDEATQVLFLIRRNTFFLLDVDTTEEQLGARTNALNRISEPLTFITPGPVLCARLSYDQRFLVLQRDEVHVDIYDLLEKAELRMTVKSRKRQVTAGSPSSKSKASAKGNERRARSGILPGGIRWCQFSKTAHALILVTYEGMELYNLNASVPKKGHALLTLGPARRDGRHGDMFNDDDDDADDDYVSPKQKSTTCKHTDVVERDARIFFHCFFALEHRRGMTSAICAVGCDGGCVNGVRQTLIRPYRVTKNFRFELLSSFTIPCHPAIRARCIKLASLYKHLYCVHMQELRLEDLPEDAPESQLPLCRVKFTLYSMTLRDKVEVSYELSKDTRGKYFEFQVIDNLIVVHNIALGTSFFFDIASGSGSLRRDANADAALSPKASEAGAATSPTHQKPKEYSGERGDLPLQVLPLVPSSPLVALDHYMASRPVAAGATAEWSWSRKRCQKIPTVSMSVHVNKEFSVRFKGIRSLGLQLFSPPIDLRRTDGVAGTYRPCVVNGFHRDMVSDGRGGTRRGDAKPAEACGQIKPGNQLLSVNGVSVVGLNFADALGAIRNGIEGIAKEDLILRFRSSMDRSNAQMTHDAYVVHRCPCHVCGAALLICSLCC